VCLRCRRKQREQKRYAKQVQAERLKEKAQTKKAGVASITKLRKKRQRDGFAGELDMDAELAGPGPGLGRKPAMAPGQRIRPGAPWQMLEAASRAWPAH
jgi:rRNA-processing protein EBP2